MTVKKIDPSGDRAGSILEQLSDRVTEAADEHGVGLAGFALVTWDMSGDVRSAFEANYGPVRPGLMPAVVHDALNRHLAVALAQSDTLENSKA